MAGHKANSSGGSINNEHSSVTNSDQKNGSDPQNDSTKGDSTKGGSPPITTTESFKSTSILSSHRFSPAMRQVRFIVPLIISLQVIQCGWIYY